MVGLTKTNGMRLPHVPKVIYEAFSFSLFQCPYEIVDPRHKINFSRKVKLREDYQSKCSWHGHVIYTQSTQNKKKVSWKHLPHFGSDQNGATIKLE